MAAPTRRERRLVGRMDSVQYGVLSSIIYLASKHYRRWHIFLSHELLKLDYATYFVVVMPAKLSVNINKIATLRNSRGGNTPDVLQVAIDCQRFGADGITVHP